jgi:two-component system, NtrC family, sensor kinase
MPIHRDSSTSDHDVKRNEDEAVMAVSFSNALMAATSEGAMVIDREYRIVKTNDIALIKTGWSAEEALGAYCYEVRHKSRQPCHSQDQSCPFREALESGKSAHAIHEMTTQSGDSRFWNVTAYPLFNSQGEVGQVLEIFREVTDEFGTHLERRAAELRNNIVRLVHEDKLISLGKLVASTAHEINNPIAAVINFIKVMLKSLEEGRPNDDDLAKFIRYLKLSLHETKRCAEITNNLLSFSRQTGPISKKIPIAEAMAEIVSLLGHKLELSGVQLDNMIDNPKLYIWGDLTQFQQVLTNLIFNAIEAMPEGGRLTLTAGRNKADNQVWIEVADTGSGITGEVMPHIFEPFFTTKGEGQGVGLGLSLVYSIVRRHGGDISAHSEPGQGTVFTVTWPTAG